MNNEFQKAKIVTEFSPRTELYHPISPSGFKVFDKCPLHYWEKYINPDHVEVKKTTKSLNLGKSFHAYRESEADFDSKFAAAPICDKRTTEGKKAFAEFELTAYGKDIISHQEYIDLKGMGKSIANDPRAWYLEGENPINEVMFETTEPEPEGVYIRGIIDRITNLPIGKVIVEYKSTKDASPYNVAKDCKDYGYYNQGNIYLRAFPEVEMILYVFIETTAPYLWQIYAIERNSDIFAITNEYVSNKLSTLSHCLISGFWPRYEMEDIKTLPLHSYYGK